ncbi:TPA: DUF6216 family protein [Escherichia coli]|nr:DUF6216 family protein [Escherichia coli]
MMNTLFDIFTSYTSRLINNELIYSIALILIILGAFYYIRWKAKSGFSISNKLFIFLIGYKKKNKNDLIDDIIDIEKFNFHYNTNATSKRQIARFEEWVRKYELDFRLISKLKRHFNIDTLKVKKIKKLHLTSVFICIFIALFTTLQTFTIAIKPALLVKMDTTGWFWINKDNAIEFSFFDKAEKPWVINKKICSSGEDNLKILSFNKEEIKVICKAFIDADDINYINKNIKEQQIFFYLVSVILIISALLCFKYLMSLTNTYDSRTMIYLKIKKFRKNK